MSTGTTAIWSNYTGTSSTTSSIIAFNTFVNTMVTAPTQAVVAYDADSYVEAALRLRLDRDRQMLLRWKHVPVPVKFNFKRLLHDSDVRNPEHKVSEMKVTEGYVLERRRTYVLPDGATLRIDDHGNYGIYDEDAQVVYAANKLREFNHFINASDLLEQFIRSMGKDYDVAQSEVLQLPVNVFIHWLILQAAKKDGDRIDDLPTVEDALPKTKMLPAPVQPWALLPKCRVCSRFISKERWSTKRTVCVKHDSTKGVLT